MNRLSSSLVISVVGAMLLIASAVATLRAQQTARAKEKKKVWTNDDLEGLRGKAGVSVVGTPPSAAADREKAGAQAPSYPRERYVKEKDAEWYREQLASLRAELSGLDKQIHELREYRSISKWMVGGMILPQANLPQNPQDQVKQLEARRRELLRKIGDLEDLARRNDIPPGVLR